MSFYHSVNARHSQHADCRFGLNSKFEDEFPSALTGKVYTINVYFMIKLSL